jgi:hypothetical protein
MALNSAQRSRTKLRIALGLCAALVIGFSVREASRDSIALEPQAASPPSSSQLVFWLGYSIVEQGEAYLAIGLLEIDPTQGEQTLSEPEVIRTWTFCSDPRAEGEGLVITAQRCVLFNDGKPDCYFEIEGVKVEAMEQFELVARSSRFDLSVAFDDEPDGVMKFACLGYQVDSRNGFFRELISRPPDDQVPPFSLSFEGMTLEPSSSSPAGWLLAIVASLLLA